MCGHVREVKSYISPYQIEKPQKAELGQFIKSNNDRFKVDKNLGREYWLSDLISIGRI